MILISLVSSCVAQDSKLIDTKWVYDYGDGCQDYFKFKDQKQYEFYSCETGDTLFGSYSLNGDLLLLHQTKGSYDQEFLEGSRHMTSNVKFKMSIENSSMIFKERWEVDVQGNWLRSDFDFPESYKFIKQ